MTDFGATGPNVRLSNAERDEAVARLNANQREGRLSEADFISRTAAVRSAVTRADLGPIFSDLPPAEYPSASSSPPRQPVYKAASDPSSAGVYPQNTAGQTYPQNAADPFGGSTPQNISSPQNAPYQGPGPSGWGGWGWGSPGSRAAYSVAPLVALVLFFLTGFLISWTWAWLWFLIVPITGAVLYAVSSGRNSGSR